MSTTAPFPHLPAGGAVGAPTARLEGPLKVTGTAVYTAEHPVDGVLTAWPVQSPVAKGVLRGIGELDGEAADGVLAVLWHGNAPRLGEVPDGELAVLASERIAYRGQVVALVVARSIEVARRAAQVVQARLEIDVEPHDVALSTGRGGFYDPEVVSHRPGSSDVGDSETALAGAEVVVDRLYSTPAEHASAMEPHASTAVWDGDRLTLHTSTQNLTNAAAVLVGAFGLEPSQVRVLSEHVGGGFGSKGPSATPDAVLAAMAARVVGRPVRLVLPRQALFAMTTHRTPTLQRVRLGASRDGRLSAVVHEAWETTSTVEEFAEATAEGTRHMYATANLRTAHHLVRLDLPTPGWVRAPGEAPGLFGLESAMDELAIALEIDPVELRLRNDATVEPDGGVPFSSRGLARALREGAQRFGWAGRDPAPRRRRDGEWWIGTGVAAATYPATAMPSTARVGARGDGTFEVAVAASDIGTGARTVLTQIAADALGVDLARVLLRLGDSSLPTAWGAGASAGTASWGWAITGACGRLRGMVADHGGTVPPAGLEATYDTTDDLSRQQSGGKHSYAAQFAEVAVSDVTGEVRARRMLGVFAAGRILNPRTARSQFLGAMTMGLGMALMEECVLDEATGGFVNHDLAEYHVPVCADVGDLDVLWLDEHDEQLNPMGSKGVGEIGMVGVAAAIANAVRHACGVRVRDLPVRLDTVLSGLSARRGS